MNKLNILKKELQNRFLSNIKEIYESFIRPKEKEWLNNRGYKFNNYNGFKEIIYDITNDLFAMVHIIDNNLEHEIFDDLFYDIEVDYHLESYDYDYFMKINDCIFGINMKYKTIAYLKIIENPAIPGSIICFEPIEIISG